MQTHLKVELLRHTYNPEETIALAARLCYSDDHIEDLAEKVKKNPEKFVQKLLDLGHESPLEHVTFTFGIEGVSRALLAQITRHRIASFSVQSQRYINHEDFDYIVPPSIAALGEDAVGLYRSQMATCNIWYEAWKDKGIPGEDARFVLPNACETRMIMTMNVRELFHFFSLRCCNRAQWEIRALAEEMLKLCIFAAPELFRNAGPSCVRGKCSEGKMSCGNAKEVQAHYGRLYSMYNTATLLLK